MFTLLTVLFVGLKLTHYINWSWWLVLMPTIVQAMMVTFFLVLAALAAGTK